jgi:hypothetical protein
MYQTIREYQTSPQSVDEILAKDEKSFVPLISHAPGFCEYSLVDSGNGMITSTSLFESRSDGENFNKVGMDWVEKNLGTLLPAKPKVISGEVRIHTTAVALVP